MVVYILKWLVRNISILSGISSVKELCLFSGSWSEKSCKTLKWLNTDEIANLMTDYGNNLLGLIKLWVLIILKA